jgi:hypothetical protein
MKETKDKRENSAPYSKNNTRESKSKCDEQEDVHPQLRAVPNGCGHFVCYIRDKSKPKEDKRVNVYDAYLGVYKPDKAIEYIQDKIQAMQPGSFEVEHYSFHKDRVDLNLQATDGYYVTCGFIMYGMDAETRKYFDSKLYPVLYGPTCIGKCNREPHNLVVSENNMWHWCGNK